MGIRKFIGDKRFYAMLMAIAVPMVVQNGITNFVSLLDNIMVGRLGTEPMSGVAIANQLIFVFNLCIFGGISGAGIFCAQFFGSGNFDGIRRTFRFKMIVCVVVTVLFVAAFAVFDEPLISLYLHEGSQKGDIAVTLEQGRQYLAVMLFGLAPFAINNAYVSTLRETGETLVPMKAGLAAVLVNFTFNWLLIFGNMGFPKLGVVGAAIATVMSRYVETGIVVAWTHRNKRKNIWAQDLYKGFEIGRPLATRIISKGWPLLLNETLYSVGTTMITQCYSTRGLSAIAAVNIASTLTNLSKVILFALGSSIAIIVGNLLGAGEMQKARDTDNKLIFTDVALCTVIGVLLFAAAPLFPLLYNTTGEVRDLAASFLRITAVMLPVMAFNHCCYYTLRSGGKTFVTFLFDSMFIWVVTLPPAFITSRYTAIGVVAMYAMVQGLEIVKSFIGFSMVKKGIWISNIVAQE